MLKIIGNRALEVIHNGGSHLQKDQKESSAKSFHQKPIKNPFLLSAKKIYLTYSHCHLSLDAGLE